MPAPRGIAHFNKRFTNRLTLKVAGHLPGFAIVTHRGRKSGKTYRTPVNAFRTADGGYIIALTYGENSDWVKNVLAAGSCELQSRGRRVRLFEPRIETDRKKEWAPLPVRLVLSLIDAPRFLRLVPGRKEAEAEPPGEAIRASLAAVALWRLDHPESPRKVSTRAPSRLTEGILVALKRPGHGG